MFNRIRISTTLFLILILCGVLQIGSNGLSFWAFRDGFQSLNQVEQSNQQRAALAQTRAVLLQASTALNKAGTLTALSYPPEDIKQLMTTARESLAQSGVVFKGFMATEASTEEGKALQAATEKSYTQWYSDLEHQATWLESNQLSDFLTAPVQASQDAFDANVTTWQQDINRVLETASEQGKDNYHRSAIIFITMVVVAALLTTGALFWSRKMIVQPLAIIGSHFDSIADGNLARPIAVYGRNEISAIFASLKAMQQALRETVSDVRQGSLAMHTGISEIAMGNNDLSSRTEQQAASLAQTAASMEQLTATVGQNADNARQASGLAKSAADTAKKGGDQASRMASTMQDIAASSQKIGDIIGVIDSIAFQTNILALNAAVEAARAGEHGKGFAVVAQEVRALAGRSANAVKEIEQLIGDTLRKVSEGHALSEQTRLAMDSIIVHIDNISQLVTEINHASREQSAGIGQVNLAMTHIGEASHINADRVSRSEQTAHTLREKGLHLTQLVSLFQLKR